MSLSAAPHPDALAVDAAVAHPKFESVPTSIFPDLQVPKVARWDWAHPPTEFFTLPDGRRLAFVQYGSAVDYSDTILFIHEHYCSRLEGMLWDEVARDAKIRIISPDRPGIGQSSPPVPPTMSYTLYDFAKDSLALLNALQVTSFWLLTSGRGGAAGALAMSALYSETQDPKEPPKPVFLGAELVRCNLPRTIEWKHASVRVKAAMLWHGHSPRMGRSRLPSSKEFMQAKERFRKYPEMFLVSEETAVENMKPNKVWKELADQAVVREHPDYGCQILDAGFCGLMGMAGRPGVVDDHWRIFSVFDKNTSKLGSAVDGVKDSTTASCRYRVWWPGSEPNFDGKRDERKKVDMKAWLKMRGVPNPEIVIFEDQTGTTMMIRKRKEILDAIIERLRGLP